MAKKLKKKAKKQKRTGKSKKSAKRAPLKIQRREAGVMTRYPGNPVLSAKDVPYHATLIFNAGITKFRDRYAMVFRNDYGDEKKKALVGGNMGLATSNDGLRWRVAAKPLVVEYDGAPIRAYDPRLTVLEGRCYMCFAYDTPYGIRAGIAVTDDLEHFEVLYLSAPDNRNMVLFPEKINGKFVRLERPFPVYGHYGRADEAFDIWYTDSPDCRYWGNNRLVLSAKQVPYSNCKIGPGSPPVKTERGWLAPFHSVYKNPRYKLDSWHAGWTKRYLAGVILLDINEPWRVIGMSRKPILDPDPNYDYEAKGFRGDVIFPTGMVLEDDGEVKIYYGAADTVMALATARVEELLDLCEPLI